ncbi:MAG: tetratricopeptide repeat protein [Pasteurellaceae bacterium]|nr:tetratricopeptide repeat protein [Pasteurellaceae bacterium]
MTNTNQQSQEQDEQLLKAAYKHYEKKYIDKVIELLAQVSPINKEPYAKAQFNLGVVLEEKGEIDEAIEAYKRVPEEIKEQYAKAQLNLGVTLKEKGEIDEAIKAYKCVPEEIKEQYAMAQFNLGVTLKEKGEIDEAINAFTNAKVNYYYESESKIKILNIFQTDNGDGAVFSDQLNKLYTDVVKILNELIISDDTITYEKRFAHYTRCQIAYSLLEPDEKEIPTFRLNALHKVNDPTEGKVLYQFLDKYDLDKQQNMLPSLIPFISCFTFNHDSLNQFRLYGKEDNKEALGVSLVFGKGFFSKETDFLNSSINPFENLKKQVNEKIFVNVSDSHNKNDNESSNAIGPLHLYRCIYLSPENGYISIAHRDKYTFFEEMNGKDRETIEMCWDEYKGKIKEKTEKIYKTLEYIYKEILRKLFKRLNNDECKVDWEFRSEIISTINFILLPLRYLIKHYGFEDEQECRMIYITEFTKHIPHNKEENSIYVEYSEPVRDNIKKIYLSSGAVDKQGMFQIMLEKPIVRLSNKPFKNK